MSTFMPTSNWHVDQSGGAEAEVVEAATNSPPPATLVSKGVLVVKPWSSDPWMFIENKNLIFSDCSYKLSVSLS